MTLALATDQIVPKEREFPPEPGPDTKIHCSMDDTCLIVRRPDAPIVRIGRWDASFGWWEQRSDGEWDQRFSRSPVLDKSGIWICAGEFWLSAEQNCDFDYRASSAWAAYFSLIPTSARRIAAPYGRWQWQALELMHARPSSAHSLELGAGGAKSQSIDMTDFIMFAGAGADRSGRPYSQPVKP